MKLILIGLFILAIPLVTWRLEWEDDTKYINRMADRDRRKQRNTIRSKYATVGKRISPYRRWNTCKGQKEIAQIQYSRRAFKCQ